MMHGADELPPQPARAGTPAEFTTALRALRTWSGLTYRQLEGKSPDPLPASTIATTLGRATLPRERFVDAFTRACGLGEDDVRQWLDARRRIAMNEPPEVVEPEVVAEPPRWRLPAVAAAVGVVVGVAGALGVVALTGSGSAGSGTPDVLSAKPVTGLTMVSQGSFARIHPAGSPELCVTEGRDRTGRYDSAVAAQKSCAEVPVPHVFLEPLADNVVQIQWQHPEFNIGCLIVMPDGPARDLLEPRDKCADDDPAQQFRLERVGTHYRFRPVVTDYCLGLRAPAAEEGAEVVQRTCTGSEDERFDIELVNPPT